MTGKTRYKVGPLEWNFYKLTDFDLGHKKVDKKRKKRHQSLLPDNRYFELSLKSPIVLLTIIILVRK